MGRYKMRGPTLYELAWGAYYYYIATRGGDDPYKKLMDRAGFLERLRDCPDSLDAETFWRKIGTDFLNKWGCRCKADIGKKLLQAVQQNVAALASVQGLSLENAACEHMTDVSRLFGSFLAIQGIGGTIAAKFAHVLNPGLFPPWDTPVQQAFASGGGGSAEHYGKFLLFAAEWARNIGDAGAALGIANPAQHLSLCLGYDPPRTLAKFFDEYNWVTISLKLQAPPAWHPDIDAIFGRLRPEPIG